MDCDKWLQDSELNSDKNGRGWGVNGDLLHRAVRARRVMYNVIMTIDERLEAIVMSLELLTRDVESLRARTDVLITAAERDGEYIRALARIAESHDRRISALEGHSEAR